MTIEKKLVFSYLREDDVQRAFFSVRPLIASDGTDFTLEAETLWPDRGYLRIVPDRREQHIFKERLRRLGGYCLINLLYHQENSGKIRSNKNYSPERGEDNRQIVYSDVILPLNEATFIEVLSGAPEDFSALADKAITPVFYILQEDRFFGPVNKGLAALPEAAQPSQGQLYTVTAPDGSVHQLLVPDAPAQPAPPPQPAQSAPERAPQPTAEAEPTAPAPEPKPPFSQPAPKNKAQAWVASQSREGRRIQQAEPLPKGLEMTEQANPVEAALETLSAAWQLPETRDQLVAGLLALPGMRDKLDDFMVAGNEPLCSLEAIAQRRADAIEAERLRALVELEGAERDSAAAREKLYRGLTAKKKEELEHLDRQLQGRRGRQKEAPATPQLTPEMLSALRATCDELTGSENARCVSFAIALIAALPTLPAGTAVPEGAQVTAEDVHALTAPVLACLPEADRDAVQNQVDTIAIRAAQAMPGGLTAACDWALRIALVPVLRTCDARPGADLLALYPHTAQAISTLPAVEAPAVEAAEAVDTSDEANDDSAGDE